MSEIEIRDFDGPLEALPEMARDTLAEEYGDRTWLDWNRPELARLHFADAAEPRDLIGAYDGGRLVGFIANLPRTYRLNGAAYRGVACVMMSTHKDYRGAAVYLIAESLRRVAEAGVDLAFFTAETGKRGWGLLERLRGGGFGFRVERLKRMRALVRGIRLDRIVESQRLKRHEALAVRLIGAHRPIAAPRVAGTVRPYRSADLDAVLELVGRYTDRNSLVRVFGRDSLARRLDAPGLTATVVYERDGAAAGFINFTVHELVSPRGRDRWAWLDLLHWDGLAPKERRALLAGLWQAGRERGCIGILEWDRGYYPKSALYLARFVPSSHAVQAFALVLNPRLQPANVKGLVELII
ncbi:MAG: GNAT family N-acetyltransferase [Candidatus Aminicenantes bacterium]|nr:GNAT family N-acetyltransferase [Candidatus Aminicenantes bacterium]